MRGHIQSSDETLAVFDDPVEGYDEFDNLEESALKTGLPWTGRPVVRRRSVMTSDGKVSFLQWGDEPPEMIFFHGRGQNAHTWDRVIMAGCQPALAFDLPGHGRSDWRDDHDHRPHLTAETIREALALIGVGPVGLIGMSHGGLTGMFLAGHNPELVKWMTIVDITPGSRARRDDRGPEDMVGEELIRGKSSFATFEELMQTVTDVLPDRASKSLMAAVRNNARELDDGTWIWAYDQTPFIDQEDATALHVLWGLAENIKVPVTLAAGGESPYVHADDVVTMRKHIPQLHFASIDGAKHAVQSHRPVELCRVIQETRQRV